MSQPKTTTSFSTTITYNLAPPVTGNYLLNFDMGLAAAGTAFTFDDILVCQQDKKVNVIMSTEIIDVLRTDTSTDFEANAPMLFKAQVTAPADASVVLRQQDTDALGAADTGAYGAAITINTPGTAPWHVQLAGPYVPLRSNKTYTIQLALKQKLNSTVSGGSQQVNAVNVNWVQPDVWVPTAVATVKPTAEYDTYTLPATSPPKDGLYYLTVDMGTVAAGTTLFFDNIKVFEA